MNEARVALIEVNTAYLAEIETAERIPVDRYKLMTPKLDGFELA